MLNIASRDPVVVLVAMWFIVGLVLRKTELKGDVKEAVDKLQTGAAAMVPILMLLLFIDTIRGWYDFFVKVSTMILLT